MIVPSSGRSGYMVFNGASIPIYDWSLSSDIQRMVYRTSNSIPYARRSGGIIHTRLRVTGNAALPIHYPAMLAGEGDLEIGWMNSDLSLTNKKAFKGVIESHSVTFNYSASQTSMMWSTNFFGTSTNSLFTTVQTQGQPADPVYCEVPKCTMNIRSSDPWWPLNDVKHVVSATLTERSEFMKYSTSSSLSFNTVPSVPILDRQIVLKINGGFDYWFDRLQDIYNPRNYSFFWGLGPIDYYLYRDMVIEEVRDIRIDVRTGAITSAEVVLGVSA